MGLSVAGIASNEHDLPLVGRPDDSVVDGGTNVK
jgi:hypothetical protein